MNDSNLDNLSTLISSLDENREWLLRNIDRGKWPQLRNELAELERELNKLILRTKENFWEFNN
tara:strand:- start:51 stop:239 length:189 start_codon:yes stop_codon:yes gene_type:complete